MTERAARTSEKQWHGRPVWSWIVRVAVVVVPFVVAMVVAFVLSSRLPVPSSLGASIVRWLGIVAVSTLAMMGADRVARRLLPLSVLLKLTLVFPDQAPSRFGIAMRTGTTAQLRRRLDDARTVPDGETPQQAAERLLELVGLLSHHDRLTRGHSERVRAYTHMIGVELGVSGAELDKLRWAALLHDVGKTAIASEILNKPGRLTDDEFDTIKTHPDEGRALVAPLADWLGESIRAVWQHHERFDGGGYPQGLRGSDISFAARVVTVADSYDVMTSARSYKKPMSAEAARAELAACSGSQFDPTVVRAFLTLSLGRLRLMTGPLAWFAQLALFEPSGVVHAGQVSASSGGSGVAGGSASVVGGGGSALASTGASTVAAAGSASVGSTVAATAASVVASTLGIAAASPVLPSPVADAAPSSEVAGVDGGDDLPAPTETVFDVETGTFREVAVADPSADPSDTPGSEATPSGSAGTGSPVAPQSITPGESRGDERVAVTTSTPGDDDDVTTTTDRPGGSATSPTTSPRSTSPGRTPTSTTDPTTSPTEPGSPTTSTTTPRPTSPGTTTPGTTGPGTTRPATTAPSTTAPATTAPATTAPPATRPTTTRPPTTTTPIPATTTTAPTTTTTTTQPPPTVPPASPLSPQGTWYLGNGAGGNTAAPTFHGISSSAPPNGALPNYDVDRDAAAGAVVRRGGGLGSGRPAELLRFRGTLTDSVTFNGRVHVELYITAKDLAKQDVLVEVGFYICNPQDQCTLIDSEVKEHKNAKKWKKIKFHLHDVAFSAAAGDRIEVRAAVLGGSESDGWFAFGTKDYDSKLVFDTRKGDDD